SPAGRERLQRHAELQRASTIHLLIIERSESRNQRQFETQAASYQIARQHSPGALAAAHVAGAGKLINDETQLALALNHAVFDLFRNADRRRSSKTSFLAVGHVSPAAQESMPLALQRDRVKASLQPDVQVGLELLLPQ